MNLTPFSVVKLDIALDPDVTSYFLQGVDRFGAEVLLAAESKWKGRRILDDLILKSLISWCRTGGVNSSPFQTMFL